LPHKSWRLLHPRDFDEELSELEQGIIEAFQADGSLDSRELEARFGAGRGMNPWGSYSRATQLALDHLHHRGLLRVSRRERGNRVYELTPAAVEALPPADRLRELSLLAANLLAPLPKTTFSHVVARIRHSMRTKDVTAAAVVKSLIADGALIEVEVEGMAYLLLPAGTEDAETRTDVRLLAPFDPLVWDRLRFEHLWGWPYRFEAYTPAAKRLRGYYAMPVLWRDAMIGWANVRTSKAGLEVDLGFVNGRPKEKAFERELATEIERLREFLAPRAST
jgi:uncharacterized protein YcaQ